MKNLLFNTSQYQLLSTSSTFASKLDMGTLGGSSFESVPDVTAFALVLLITALIITNAKVTNRDCFLCSLSIFYE